VQRIDAFNCFCTLRSISSSICSKKGAHAFRKNSFVITAATGGDACVAATETPHPSAKSKSFSRLEAWDREPGDTDPSSSRKNEG
jgi:hypothetical protein